MNKGFCRSSLYEEKLMKVLCPQELPQRMRKQQGQKGSNNSRINMLLKGNRN